MDFVFMPVCYCVPFPSLLLQAVTGPGLGMLAESAPLYHFDQMIFAQPELQKIINYNQCFQRAA